MQWDVFVRVIDNYGDVGVCWRLACGLAARGEQVRLWLDDLTALDWMAPGPVPGVTVQAWAPDSRFPAPGEVLVEAFGCDPAPEFIAACAESARAGGRFHAWINLEYLSAEPFVERVHGLPSPVLSGAGQGLTKHFFYPRFTARTGGFVRGPSGATAGSGNVTAGSGAEGVSGRTDWSSALPWAWVSAGSARAAPASPPPNPSSIPGSPAPAAACGGAPSLPAAIDPQRARADWLADRGALDTGERLISLFCYEPAALPEFLGSLAADPVPTRLLVTPGRARAAVDAAWARLDLEHPPWNHAGPLRREDLGWLTQTGFDRLRADWAFKLVRGEDSLVRAIWAGRPFAWQIYPQDDDAHQVKLDAFLDQMEAPDDWRAFHAAWNAPQPQMLPPLRLEGWGQAALGWRQRLLAQGGLVTQLLRFARKKR